MHKPAHGSGRKSDAPIVAKKRLIPVERRGATVNAQLSKKGMPIDGDPIFYGETGLSPVPGRLYAGAGDVGETLSFEMEAEPKGQARADVSVLHVVRPHLPGGHAVDGMAACASQPRRGGCRWSRLLVYREQRRRSTCLVEADTRRARDQDLSANASPTGLHPQSQRKAAAIGHPHRERPRGPDGRPAHTGAYLRGRFRGLLLWVPTGTLCTPGPRRDSGTSERGVLSGLR